MKSINVRREGTVFVALLAVLLVMGVVENLKWREAASVAENITESVIKKSLTMDKGETLAVHGLPQYSSSHRMVYPNWDTYSLPKAVMIYGKGKGAVVKVVHADSKICAMKKVTCLHVKDLAGK